MREHLMRIASRVPEAEVELDGGRPWSEVETALADAVTLARRLRVRVRNVDFDGAAALATFLQRCYEALQSKAAGLPLEDADVFPCFTGDKPCSLLEAYEWVVLGGTFDHLHAGHKVLLSVSVALAEVGVAVGVSGAPLLVKKQHATELEPWDVRAGAVSSFIGRSRSDVSVLLEELSDGFGPSLRREMRALVVSEETVQGGAAVNCRRSEVGVPEIDMVVVPLVAAASAGDGKESSTTIRRRAQSLRALNVCWASVASELRLDTALSEKWAVAFGDLARTPLEHRRSLLDRVHLELVDCARQGEGTTSTTNQMARSLALCVTCSRPLAPGRLVQAQLALLDVVAVEVELPDSLHDATRRLVLHLSRPRVIGLASRSCLGGADLVAAAASVLQELGAVVVDAPTDSSVESQLVQGAAFVVLVQPVGSDSIEHLCDEVWAFGAEPSNCDEVCLPPHAEVNSALRKLCEERGLMISGGLPHHRF